MNNWSGLIALAKWPQFQHSNIETILHCYWLYVRRCLRMLTKKIFHAGFGLLCGGIILYVAVLAFIEYYHNADATNISFKTFNVSPIDENPYPDITFCFNGRKHVYRKEFLKTKYSISDNDYYELLSGSKIVWSKMANKSTFAEINFDEAWAFSFSLWKVMFVKLEYFLYF